MLKEFINNLRIALITLMKKNRVIRVIRGQKKTKPMQKNELTNVLNSAISDLEKTRGLLNIAADELHRRGKREVQLQTLRRRSTAPAEYLEEDALIWSAETLETMICQLKAVHKRVKSNSKF